MFKDGPLHAGFIVETGEPLRLGNRFRTPAEKNQMGPVRFGQGDGNAGGYASAATGNDYCFALFQGGNDRGLERRQFGKGKGNPAVGGKTDFHRPDGKYLFSNGTGSGTLVGEVADIDRLAGHFGPLTRRGFGKAGKPA
jgi:hypothetical protein